VSNVIKPDNVKKNYYFITQKNVYYKKIRLKIWFYVKNFYN